MNTQTFELNIGDEIGFVILASDVDSNDETVFFEISEITEKDGERAYRYAYPDGTLSRAIIKHSEAICHALRLKPRSKTQGMLCVSERRSEFLDAMKRAENSNFEVFNGFDKDTYHVKNRENGNEYFVRFETENGKTFAECECPDFQYRKRTCKHIGEVLTQVKLGMILSA